jgi:multiple sugar transport system substrate-binding protein
MIRFLHAALLAAVMLRPLSALCAEFVVWWEEGLYHSEDVTVAEVIAAFEQESGKEVELVFQPILEVLDRTQAATDAGRPPDFLFGPVVDSGLEQWAYEDRLVDLTDTVGPLAGMFDADALNASILLNGRTGKRALYTLPMGRTTNHVHVWNNLLERAGFTLADIPKEWEAFWSFWCDRVQPAVRQALGRDDIWAVGLAMSVEAGDTFVELAQFQNAYHAYWASADGEIEVDNPAMRANLIKALAAYTAIYRKGCTPPDAIDWQNKDNNDAFVAQTVVMTANETLSIPNAIKASRPDDYRDSTATIEWPNDAHGQPLAIYADLIRGAVFRTEGPAAVGKEFVRFLVEEGWLAHYLDFAVDRWLPPMRKLVEAPFWLDSSDRHRMASAIQSLTRPQRYDVGIAVDKAFKDQTWQQAVYRVAAEGITPSRRSTRRSHASRSL